MKKGRVKSYAIFSAIALCFCGSSVIACVPKPTASGTQEQLSQTDKALQGYREFLKTEDLYRMTATSRYPRGDSNAVYSFGDCNGDDVPELHVDGGGTYSVYTFQDEKVVLLHSFDSADGFGAPSVLPLADGSFIISERWSHDNESDVSSQGKVPETGEEPLPEKGYDVYDWIRLDSEGNYDDSRYHSFSTLLGEKPGAEQICERDGCQETAVNFLNMLENSEKHLEQLPLFPEEEWDYLNSMEEGNGIETVQGQPEEWEVFEEILSGNFARVTNLMERSRLYSEYEGSLDENTGRSHWSYILRDINGDGKQELLVQYAPDALDYTDLEHIWSKWGLFSYQDGHLTWSSYGWSHESYIPLKNGQMLYVDSYGSFENLMLGRMEGNFEFNPWVIYEKISEYDTHLSQDWYKENLAGETNWALYTFCERLYEYPKQVKGEGEFYFTQDCDNGKTGDIKELSAKEWTAIMENLQEQLIPAADWNPASVFPPVRRYESFSQG